MTDLDVGQLRPARTSPREPGDFVLGCGIPAEGQTSGKSCAGVGTEPACHLCPQSPSYWRNAEPTTNTRSTQS